MTGFNHTLAGTVSAALLPGPIAPLAALASHFVFDAFPHFGRHEKLYPYTKPFIWLLVGDGILCVAAVIFSFVLFPDKWLIVALCMFLSILPDFLWLLDGKVKWMQPFFKFAGDIQWGERPWGWILELVYGVIFVVWLIVLSY